jgi:hypothetical protein
VKKFEGLMLHLGQQPQPIDMHLQIGLHNDWLDSTHATLGNSALKFGFLYTPAYSLPRCKDREVAKWVMERFDEMLANNIAPHRALSYFLHPSSFMRASWERHVNEGIMDEEFGLALAPYVWGTLDETPGEGVHRQVSIETSRAGSTSHPYGASTMRMPQNRNDWDSTSADPKARALFLQAWRFWRMAAISPSAQSNSARLRVPRDVRALPKLSCAKVAYRMDAASFTDWSALKPLFQNRMAGKIEFTDVLRLQSAFIQKAITRLGVFSLPSDAADNWAITISLGTPDAACHGVEGDVTGDSIEADHSDRVFFRVLDLEPFSKKTPTRDGRLANATLPMQVQRLGCWLRAPGASRVDVFVESPPEVVDLVGFQPWLCWRHALRKWDLVGPSDVEGCLSSTDARFATLFDDCEDSDVPMAVALERLASKGWRAGRQCDKPHTSAEDKSICLESGFSRRPSYATCLLSLASLFSKGVDALPCAENECFYICILTIPDKRIVKPGLAVAQYQHMLSQFLMGHPLDPLKYEVTTLVNVKTKREAKQEPIAMDRTCSGSSRTFS